MGNRWWAVLWLGLLPMRGAATASPDSGDSVPKEPSRSWSSLARLEVAPLAFLPRAGGGETEGFVQLEPTLILDGGPEFGLNLGAPVRLRAWGGACRVRRAEEARWQKTMEGKLYAVATSGTLRLPGVDGALRPGAFASVGLEVDNAR
ncbi:hypothetical protein [Corallococcus exiguus]|uniref:hypothetical protein n=1 Tax=Corallococcus exiguus TaxID=83462 RepID=UPI003D27BCC2